MVAIWLGNPGCFCLAFFAMLFQLSQCIFYLGNPCSILIDEVGKDERADAAFGEKCQRSAYRRFLAPDTITYSTLGYHIQTYISSIKEDRRHLP